MERQEGRTAGCRLRAANASAALTGGECQKSGSEVTSCSSLAAFVFKREHRFQALLLLGVEGAGERGSRFDAEDFCPATDNHHVEVYYGRQ